MKTVILHYTMESLRTDAHLHTLFYQYIYSFPVAVAIAYVVYQRFFSPLAKVPGPFWASLTRFWLVKVVRESNYHRVAQQLHAKYGSVVRIAPDEVSVSDLDGFRKIYGSGSRFPKSSFYGVFQGTRVFDLFAGQDEAIHGKHRKLVARAYTMETLKDLEPYVDKMLDIFTTKMDEQVEQNIDMSNWLQLFAFGTFALLQAPEALH
jgi:cytochrome P450